MTTYRLFPSTNGPSAASADSGNYLAGVTFEVTQAGLWFTGYWWWVSNTGQQSGAQEFALWQVLTATTGVLIPGSVVTSGALTVGAWNYVSLATPLPLSLNTGYMAATGYVSTTGFPLTQNQFGSGDPFSGGITNGPLFAFQAGGFVSIPQGVFSSTLGADPSAAMPDSAFNDSNFWVDLQVTNVAPSGATYRLWPNLPTPLTQTQDTANNFTLATEFTLSQACTLNRIWFYSPSVATQLPTETGIWTVAGQSLVSGTHLVSPTWSGAAGSGWVSVTYPANVLLPANVRLKTSVFNGAASPTIWNVSFIQYWNVAGGSNGITTGPLSAPNLANASAPGQSTYNQGATFAYPNTYDSTGTGDNYWVDVEVTPAPPASASGPFRSWSAPITWDHFVTW